MRRSRPAGMAAMLIGVPVGASGQNTNGCVRRRKCHRLVIDRASIIDIDVRLELDLKEGRAVHRRDGCVTVALKHAGHGFPIHIAQVDEAPEERVKSC
jgi:hypothetical protein